MFVLKNSLILLVLLFGLGDSLRLPKSDDNDINLKIVGGQVGNIKQFPYQVSIFTETRPNWGEFCGGVILNPNWIVTAAHCLKVNGTAQPASSIKVRPGLDSVNQAGSWNAENIHVAAERFLHPDYNSKTFVNDIALIRLQDPIQYTGDTVQRACVDYSDQVYNYYIASGYGSVTKRYMVNGVVNDDTDGNELKYAFFKETRDDCPDNNMFVCINSYYKNSGDSICYADSGGPLTTPYGRVIGVLSNMPAVYVSPNKYVYCEGHSKYTRLSNFAYFINEHVGTDNYCWNN